MFRIIHLLVGLTVLLLIPARFASAQYLEEETVQAASIVFNETMATPGYQIPQAMLADAHGVAIIPNVIKGSFVVGARHGRGLLFIREANGIWHAPVFITLTGGNIGWQVGLKSSDIILVFKTPNSVQNILSGKLTLGADVAVAAGPIGRQAAAATDGRLRAEIYAYSRSRGLFAGVSIDGSVVRMDQFATGAYYRSPAPGQPVIVPPSAQQLTQAIVAYTGAAAELATAATVSPQNPTVAHQHVASEADLLRGQLAQLAPQLYELLDGQWKSYLALPASLFLNGEHPTADQLAATLQNFENVAGNQQYQQLASRAEFQSVYGVLKHYRQSLLAIPSTLQLPPPPAASVIAPR